MGFNLSGAFFCSRRACQSRLPAWASAKISSAAARKFSLVTTASAAPTFKAASARFSVPPAIHSMALSAPIKRGKRTQPPQPGIIPSLVSGKPIFAVSAITRKSVVSNISQPPPNAKPLTAVTVGKGKSSMALNNS